SIDFTGGRQVVNLGTVFCGPGSFMVENGPSGCWVVNCSITAPAKFSFVGGTVDLVGTLRVPGRFNWTGGTLTGSGGLVVEKGATLDIATSASSRLRNDAVLINDGTVSWSEAGGEILGTGTIDNDGGFSIVGHDPLHQPYSNPLDGALNNSGTLVVDGA